MTAGRTGVGRRQWTGSVLALLAHGAWAQPAARPSRALREMRIHRVAELGLVIWVENQPPWEAGLQSTPGGHPSFVAQSPDSYFPPTALSYASWPGERVAAHALPQVARTAVRRASLNFGLSEAQSRALFPQPASHGVLHGFESDFAGSAHGQELDVKVFVGQAPERFVLALSAYTLRGRMGVLDEVLRRAWGQLRYL